MQQQALIVPITIKEANDFVFNFHRHNRPTVGGKWAIGLELDGELVGVAIVGRAIARKLDDRFINVAGMVLVLRRDITKITLSRLMFCGYAIFATEKHTGD